MSTIEDGEWPAVVVRHSGAYRWTATVRWGDERTTVRSSPNMALCTRDRVRQVALAARDRHAARYNHGEDFLPLAGHSLVVSCITQGEYVVSWIPAWALGSES